MKMKPMKCLMVLTFDLDTPEDAPRILKELNPPDVQGFTGIARVVLDPHATAIEEWLDEN